MSKMTRQDLEREIAHISEVLKGPMSNMERVLLVEDRKELRELLNFMLKEKP